MTELQKVEFNILKTVIKICEDLKIKYFLVCGSALGAVKYKGFIPWDDDIDVGMLREDYCHFLQKAEGLLPEYYFLQNYHTDPECPFLFSKVRDSRTTYIESSVAKINMNHGVFVDIFPLDFYPKSVFKQRVLECKKKIYAHQIACIYNIESPRLMSRWLKKFNRLLGYHRKTGKTLEKYEKAISLYRGKRSDIICNHGNWQGKLEYAPGWHYGDGTWAMFEGLKVRIPENYDAYLTQKYGNWRADLPKEERVGHHFYDILDLNKPYTEYLK